MLFFTIAISAYINNSHERLSKHVKKVQARELKTLK